MCARTTITLSATELMEILRPDIVDGQIDLPRYNAAPTQMLPVLYIRQGKTVLTQFRWGLIPSWAKEAAIGVKMINARAETLSEKVSFKRLLSDRRCLVPVDGFYEWVARGSGKVPMRVTLKSNALFALAGLWDAWKSPDGALIHTYTIVTTSSEPHALMKTIHGRMPVILDPSNERNWLDAALPYDRVLSQNRSPELEAYEVSKAVNSPRNDSPLCSVRSILPGLN